MRANISLYWVCWEQRRIRELLEQGCSVIQAQEAAHNEAIVRADAAKLVGNEAALDAELVVEKRFNMTVGIYAKVRESRIPADRLAKAQDWAGSKMKGRFRPFGWRLAGVE